MRHDDEASRLRQCLLKAAELGRVDIAPSEIEIRFQDPPHDRPSLPFWSQAIYVFRLRSLYLKVGRAGPNSRSRMSTQHYTASTEYSLANLISENAEPLMEELSREEVQSLEALPVDRVGEWIANNCGRINIFIPAEYPRTTANLFEAVLLSRFDPCYEGPRDE